MNVPRKPRSAKPGGQAKDGMNKPRSSSNIKSVSIRVGPVDYELFLYSGWLEHESSRCFGLADLDNCRIFISDAAPIRKRIATFWHEFGHAIITECGLDDYRDRGEEVLCNMLGIGLVAMDVETLTKVYELLSLPTAPKRKAALI